MIIRSYLRRELFHAFLGIMVILLLVVMCNMFVHYLGAAASGSMTGMDVIKLMGLLLPKYMITLLPIAFFLAILLAYGRLFANKELLVMFACGLSWRQLLWITMLPAALVCLCVLFLSLYIGPIMTKYTEQLTSSASNSNNLDLLKSGRFIPLQQGSQVVYIGGIDSRTQTIQDLFLYRDPGNGNPPQIVLAPTGVQTTDPVTGQSYILLKNGVSYKAMPKDVNYQEIDFKTYSYRISSPVAENSTEQVDSLGTLNLLSGGGRASGYSQNDRIAEFQWRMTFPIATIVLMVLGLTFCYVRPRQGRYAKLIPAVLIFIVYFNLLTMGHSWLQEGVLPAWLGMWWIHIVFLCAGLFWLLYSDGHTFWRAKKEK